jgi:hypothetical protein
VFFLRWIAGLGVIFGPLWSADEVNINNRRNRSVRERLVWLRTLREVNACKFCTLRGLFLTFWSVWLTVMLCYGERSLISEPSESSEQMLRNRSLYPFHAMAPLINCVLDAALGSVRCTTMSKTRGVIVFVYSGRIISPSHLR